LTDLRVAFDAGPLLDPPTGVGRYAGELSDALRAEGIQLEHFAVAMGGDETRASARGLSIKRWRFPAKWARSVWRRFDQPSIEKLTGPVDLVHGTNFVLPALGDARGVVTVHDLSFFRDDVFPGGERLRDLVPWSVERAAKVIVPAAAIGAEVVDRFGVDPQKVSVTHEGVAPLFFGASPLADSTLEKMGIPGRYAVAVGTIEPRKNLPRLLEAWKEVRRTASDLTLVLAGPKGWGPELPEAEGVVLSGWVGDETLPGLLAGAEFFCYPSLYEGFGLPPLEAMAAGTPVIAGRYSVAEEVLGDAALLVDPYDVDALTDALRDLALDQGLRKTLSLAGRAKAGGYSWDRTARATIRAYREALST
jgi:glycosyltransferase involved in cell wall biosynthesis